MSALAEILLSKGFKVTGSDCSLNSYTESLESHGVAIYPYHDEKNVFGADIVVYSSAIKSDNPERRYAENNGILCIERSVLLGEIEKLYRFPIDISGTHGKTSTTGMLSHIFLACEKDPTILIGGVLDAIGGNKRVGKSDYFVSEACEYCRSFLQFHPYIAIILDIEEDHLDYYKNLDDIKDAFSEFANISSNSVVINADDKNTVDAMKNVKTKIVTTSRCKKADFYAMNIEKNSFGAYSFDVYSNDTLLTRVSLAVPGIHHVSNALCAFAAAYLLNLPSEKIAEGLSLFRGVKRRFELKGNIGGVRVYDDYAHHPTEIKATLEALNDFSSGDKYIVFQPHTYTRTLSLFDDFISVLSSSKNLILLDIYAAREKDTGKVSSQDLADKIPGSYMAQSFEDASSFISSRVKEGDVVMTIGAGDVYKVGEKIIELLSNQNQ